MSIHQYQFAESYARTDLRTSRLMFRDRRLSSSGRHSDVGRNLSKWLVGGVCEKRKTPSILLLIFQMVYYFTNLLVYSNIATWLTERCRHENVVTREQTNHY